MPIANAQVTVAETRVRLSSDIDIDYVLGSSIVVHNVGGVSIWLGNSDVTPNNGYELMPGTVFSADTVSTRDGLHAVAESGSSSTVHVLQVGV